MLEYQIMQIVYDRKPNYTMETKRIQRNNGNEHNMLLETFLGMGQ